MLNKMTLSCFTATGCAYPPDGHKSLVESKNSSHKPTEDGTGPLLLK